MGRLEHRTARARDAGWQVLGRAFHLSTVHLLLHGGHRLRLSLLLHRRMHFY